MSSKKWGQVILRHTERTAYRCFLPDLAGFTGFCCTGPGPGDIDTMKPTFRMMAVALATLLISACATLAPPQPREFRLSQAQLQDLVGKRFELARTYLGFLDVKLATPRVTLQPDSKKKESPGSPSRAKTLDWMR